MRHSRRPEQREGRASQKVAAPYSRTLVVMVKEPHAGRVKTRLGREIGTVAATSFYRHAAAAVIRRLSSTSRWYTWLAVAPDLARDSRYWDRGIRRRPQGGGDLGARMQRIMDWPGSGPILIIGTDIPAIQPRHIWKAFRALGNADAVFGPTPDGGYWLVGLRRAPRTLRPFAGVRWSSEHALPDTIGNLAGQTFALADRLSDVDNASEWHAVRGWSGRRILPGTVPTRTSTPA